MGRPTNRPLTLEEAKLRLLATAEHLSLREWVRHKPWQAMAVAAASGFVTAWSPRLQHGAARHLLRHFSQLM